MSDNIKDIDQERLAKQLSEMAWDIEPERDLWPDITARLEPRLATQASSASRRTWMPFAIAASVTLALVSVLFSSFTAMNTKQLADMQQSMLTYQQAQLSLIEEQHKMVRVQFVRLLQQDQSLDPNFIREIEQAMLEVDTAAEQIKLAIQEQPNNPDYVSMLVETYQHELKLLNRVKSNAGSSI